MKRVYMNYMITKVNNMLLLGLIIVGVGDPALATTCLDNCHQSLTSTRYLHGPIAAEQAGAKGCTMCHLPYGKACTSSKAGKFKLREKDMCLICHEKGTGTQHTATKDNCLKCHDPHGSETSPFMVRESK